MADIQKAQDKVLSSNGFDAGVFQYNVEHLWKDDLEVMAISGKIDACLTDAFAGRKPEGTVEIPAHFTHGKCFKIYSDSCQGVLEHILTSAVAIKESGGELSEANPEWLASLEKLGDDHTNQEKLESLGLGSDSVHPMQVFQQAHRKFSNESNEYRTKVMAVEEFNKTHLMQVIQFGPRLGVQQLKGFVTKTQEFFLKIIATSESVARPVAQAETVIRMVEPRGEEDMTQSFAPKVPEPAPEVISEVVEEVVECGTPMQVSVSSKAPSVRKESGWFFGIFRTVGYWLIIFFWQK